MCSDCRCPCGIPSVFIFFVADLVWRPSSLRPCTVRELRQRADSRPPVVESYQPWQPDSSGSTSSATASQSRRAQRRAGSQGAAALRRTLPGVRDAMFSLDEHNPGYANGGEAVGSGGGSPPGPVYGSEGLRLCSKCQRPGHFPEQCPQEAARVRNELEKCLAAHERNGSRCQICVHTGHRERHHRDACADAVFIKSGNRSLAKP